MDSFEINGALVHVLPNAFDLTRAAAERFLSIARQSVDKSGRFMVALSGGTTPANLYNLLSHEEYKDSVPWDKTQIFWGDERCVPHESNDSNYKMANETLLSRIKIPAMNLHPTVGQDEDPARSAANYEASIRTVFHQEADIVPGFDLILLGLGTEGHTASLFPGSEALKSTQQLVMAVYVEKLKSYRITFTPRLLNNARHIVFLAEGAGKKDILPEVLKQPQLKLPAQEIRPVNGTLEWYLDAAAAVNLNREASLS